VVREQTTYGSASGTVYSITFLVVFAHSHIFFRCLLAEQKPTNKMGVKEELEALRTKGVTKNFASKLQGASGLSTPEAEEQAIKKEQERVRIGNYGKDAEKNLQSYNEAKVAVQKGGDGSVISPAKGPSIPKADAKVMTTTVTTPSTAAPAPAAPAPAAKAETPAAAPAPAAKAETPAAAPAPAAKAETPAAAPAPAAKAETPATAPAPAAKAETPAPAPAVEAAADDEVPTLEELPDMEEMPALDVSGGNAVVPPVSAPVPSAPINRAERKARRMMEKLGMKPVPGISQVVLKMRGGGIRGGIFTIVGPDVFEKSGSYVVFGEARQGGGGNPAAQQAQQAQAIQQLAALAKNSEGSGIEVPAPAAAGASETAKAEEALDESGLDAGNIDLCMTQAGCSRAKAVKALRDNDGDLVNAIMSLTT